MRLKREDSLLLVIDPQQKLVPAMKDPERVLARTDALVTAAGLFAVPKLITEHCPNQIGLLVEPLRGRFAEGEIYVKSAFSATDHPEFMQKVRASGRRQIVIAGMEAHVCVLQTVLGLVGEGCAVLVVGDAVGSRAPRLADRQFALERMARAGCTVAGTETVLFEWARAGDDPAFRDILALVRALPA
jgi:nicotinamidase-related amidase